MNDTTQTKHPSANRSAHALLGKTTIDGVHADLFVCGDIGLARFSSHPDDYEAAHLKSLSITSNVFLLVAFRLYLDRLHVGQPSNTVPTARRLEASLQS